MPCHFLILVRRKKKRKLPPAAAAPNQRPRNPPAVAVVPLPKQRKPVAIAHPGLGLGAHTLTVCLGAFAGGPNISVVGVILLFGHFHPGLETVDVDFVLTGWLLIFVGFHRLSFPPGQRRAKGHKKVCAIRYADHWHLIVAQQEQGTDIAASP